MKKLGVLCLCSSYSCQASPVPPQMVDSVIGSVPMDGVQVSRRRTGGTSISKVQTGACLLAQTPDRVQNQFSICRGDLERG